jgi:hypothetical protein
VAGVAAGVVAGVAVVGDAAAAAAAEEGGDVMSVRRFFQHTGLLMNASRVVAVCTLASLALLGTGAPVRATDTPAKKGPPNITQSAYATPEDATRALYEAMKGEDVRRIYGILGPGSGKLIYTGDKVADNDTRDLFVAAYDQSAKFEREGDGKATLLLGKNDYPFPFPLVKKPNGWMFDAHAGAEEIVNRRIGENEIGSIQTCLALVDAQREYVLRDRNSNGLLEYAQRIVSSPGKQDGLYWPAAEGQPASPLGPLVADANARGYSQTTGAYHGYKFKVLTAQGKDAPGGAYDYIVNGKMIGGFAFVGWPARWGVSGVMTFVCNHEGVVYQKNLGRDTASIAAKMTRYDPDASWSATKP